MKSLIAVLVALVAINGHGPLQAQTWPNRPVTLVVPYPAGGSQDVVVRLLSPGLTAALGQQVVVENVGGAGGVVGVSRVAKAAPDGYQFLLGNVGTHAQNQSLYERPAYDAAGDFIPVSLLVDQSMVLAVLGICPPATWVNSLAISETTPPRRNTAPRVWARQRISHAHS